MGPPFSARTANGEFTNLRPPTTRHSSKIGSKLKTDITTAEHLGHLIIGICITRPAILIGRVGKFIARRTASSADQVTRSVLIVLVEQLGDIVLSSDYLRNARTCFPGARITLVIDRLFIPYVQSCPDVDEVVGLDLAGSKYWRAVSGPLRSLALGWKLRNRYFDIAINGRWDGDSRHGSLVGVFSYPLKYIGYSSASTPRRSIINSGLDKAFTDIVKTTQVVHESRRGNEMLRALGHQLTDGKPYLWLADADFDYARKEIGDTRRNIVALGIGASEAKRRWPIDRFVAVAKHILAVDPQARFLVVGHKGDAQKAEEMRTHLGESLLNLAGTCSIAQSGALLSLCSLYVGNDSGPLHMAAAAGIPVVEISCHPPEGAPEHANSPDRYRPLIDPHRVKRPAAFAKPCRYACTAREPHCILGVEVDAVAEAIDLVLGRQPQGLETAK